MPRATAVPIVRVGDDAARTDQDLVAIEAPLGVELVSARGGPACRVGVLMRTPGDDLDLIRGWLYSERIIRDVSEIVAVDLLDPSDADDRSGTPPGSEPVGARATITLVPSVAIEEIIQHRVLTPTSACGLCGRLAVDRLQSRRNARPPDARTRWPSALVASLPAALRAAQTVFAETGGLHAAGLFDDEGRLQIVREDIGRHNAVDKVVGAALVADRLNGRCPILVVSGRAAFEIVQKAAIAGLSVIVAVGAPSDMAIAAARETDVTLVGFARAGRFNVYAGAARIDCSPRGGGNAKIFAPL
jgi:FdhD protein